MGWLDWKRVRDYRPASRPAERMSTWPNSAWDLSGLNPTAFLSLEQRDHQSVQPVDTVPTRVYRSVLLKSVLLVIPSLPSHGIYLKSGLGIRHLSI